MNETVPVGPTHLCARVSRPWCRVWNPVDDTDLPHASHDRMVSFILPAVSEHTVVLIECEPGGDPGQSALLTRRVL